MDGPPINLEGLSESHVGVTPALGAAYIEAASVCLSRRHKPPVSLTVFSVEAETQHSANWKLPDERVLNAWANETDATRDGAYAVSFAVLEVSARLVAVRRAETLTGADYYVAAPGTPPQNLESCLRLEVSGMQAGDLTAIRRRLAQKQEQARRGKSNLPALAAVVGFAQGTVAYAPVNDA